MDTYNFKIKRLIVDSPVRKAYAVGTANDQFCREINEIQKSGEMAMVTWYQVIDNDGTIREVNGKYVVEIEYEKADIK